MLVLKDAERNAVSRIAVRVDASWYSRVTIVATFVYAPSNERLDGRKSRYVRLRRSKIQEFGGESRKTGVFQEFLYKIINDKKELSLFLLTIIYMLDILKLKIFLIYFNQFIYVANVSRTEF